MRLRGQKDAHTGVRDRVRKRGVLLRRVDGKATVAEVAGAQGWVRVELDEQARVQKVRGDDRGAAKDVQGAGGQVDVLVAREVRVALRARRGQNGIVRGENETVVARVDGVPSPD